MFVLKVDGSFGNFVVIFIGDANFWKPYLVSQPTFNCRTIVEGGSWRMAKILDAAWCKKSSMVI